MKQKQYKGGEKKQKKQIYTKDWGYKWCRHSPKIRQLPNPLAMLLIEITKFIIRIW